MVAKFSFINLQLRLAIFAVVMMACQFAAKAQHSYSKNILSQLQQWGFPNLSPKYSVMDTSKSPYLYCFAIFKVENVSGRASELKWCYFPQEDIVDSSDSGKFNQLEINWKEELNKYNSNSIFIIPFIYINSRITQDEPSLQWSEFLSIFNKCLNKNVKYTELIMLPPLYAIFTVMR
jgi:hypothetical protein